MKKNILLIIKVLLFIFLISCNGNNKKINENLSDEYAGVGLGSESNDNINLIEDIPEWEVDARKVIEMMYSMSDFIISAIDDNILDEEEIKFIKEYNKAVENLNDKYIYDFSLESKFIEYIEIHGTDASVKFEEAIYKAMEVKGFDKIME